MVTEKPGASPYGHLGKPCPGDDETCPGQDGDPCHYLGPDAWRVPPKRVLAAGWAFPGNSRKAHFFPAGSMESLCGKWGFFAGRRDTENLDAPSADDCVACRRKRA